MDLPTAIKLIRKELVVKDQPLKAYNLLKAVDLPELEELKKKSYGMVRHVFDYEEFKKAYDIAVDDCVYIEPEEVVLDPSKRFARYAWIVEEVEKIKPKSIIDLGCYVGSLPIYFASKGYDATGVDFTSAALKVAESRNQKYADGKAKFHQADISKFDKGKYDIVYSFETFEHMIDPAAYIHHLAGLTNPGGWVYITTPDGPYLNGKGNLEMEGGWEWKEGDGCRGHLYVFNKYLMKKLLKGYEVERLTSEPDGLLWVKYRKKVS